MQDVQPGGGTGFAQEGAQKAQQEDTETIEGKAFKEGSRYDFELNSNKARLSVFL